MDTQKIEGGTFHKLPADLQKALALAPDSVAAWKSITPLARNEWICWVENAKMLDTRKHRIARTVSELAEGKRRPCCWMGCIHRTDKEMSASQKFILAKKSALK